MIENEKVPNILDYEDYREFLKARFLFLKSRSSRFSYRYFARKAGVTDNFFKYIFDLKKNLTLDRVSKTAAAFKLNREETQYLTFKVIRRNVEEPIIAQSIDHILSCLKFKIDHLEKGLHSRLASEDRFEARGFLNAAILSLIALPSFRPDPQWIRDTLIDGDKFTLAQVKEAFERILNSKLVEKKAGRWVLREEHMLVSEDFDLETSSYNAEMVKKLDDFYINSAKYKKYSDSILMLNINDDDFEKLGAVRKEFIKKIIQISEESKNPNRVYSAYGIVFALSKNTDK